MSGTNLPSSFDGNTAFYEENRWQKLSRRLKEEPLVPLGTLVTCWALVQASKSIRRGDHHYTQRMFRLRIMGQFFTIIAMVAGSMYYAKEREKRKEFDGLLSQNRAKEKHEAWLRELEARDEEEKEMKARKARYRQARQEELAAAASSGEITSVLEKGEGRGDGRVLAAVIDLVKGRSWSR